MWVVFVINTTKLTLRLGGAVALAMSTRALMIRKTKSPRELWDNN
jgi:hypothetical protein